MKKSWLQAIADGADLPGEGLPGKFLLELLGDQRVLIENHEGILEYGRERIQVRVKIGRLCICGEKLHLSRMQGQQLVISGRIQTVSIDRGKC